MKPSSSSGPKRNFVSTSSISFVFVILAILLVGYPTSTSAQGMGVRLMTDIGAGRQVLMHLLDPGAFPVSRAQLLVLIAARSTCTATPVSQDCVSLINPQDRVVVTNSFIFWLQLVPGSLSITNGGAGMMRGIWSIYCCDGSGSYNFARIENPYNWAPNEMFPGAAPGNGGSGMSLQMRLINNIDTPDPYSCGIENSDDFSLTIDGSEINDGGLFSGDGVFYQTSGAVAHFETNVGVLQAHGFRDKFDMNADPNLYSQVHFVLTYRFSPTAQYFRQELGLSVAGPDPASPFATCVMSSCGYGSAPWSADRHVAAVGRIRNHNLDQSTCSSQVEYAPNQVVQFNQNAIHGGLDYFENNVLSGTGGQWRVFGPSGRSWALQIPGGSGFVTPNFVQPLLNGYSDSGTGVVCLDINYFNTNDCGKLVPWPVGYVFETGADYSTY